MFCFVLVGLFVDLFVGLFYFLSFPTENSMFIHVVGFLLSSLPSMNINCAFIFVFPIVANLKYTGQYRKQDSTH